MKFEWDEVKNERNKKVHGIGFEEAKELFDGVYSDLTRYFEDDRFNYKETREIVIGMLNNMVIVSAVYTERLNDGIEVIRFISARKATSQEIRWYERR